MYCLSLEHKINHLIEQCYMEKIQDNGTLEEDCIEKTKDIYQFIDALLKDLRDYHSANVNLFMRCILVSPN